MAAGGAAAVAVAAGKGSAGNGTASGPQAGASSGRIVSRTAAALAMDWPPTDPSTYWVGTEEGMVQGCSVTYTEQTRMSMKSHTGPVYSLRVSPFLHSAVLTSAADWSIRLWDMGAHDGPEEGLLHSWSRWDYS